MKLGFGSTKIGLHVYPTYNEVHISTSPHNIGEKGKVYIGNSGSSVFESNDLARIETEMEEHKGRNNEPGENKVNNWLTSIRKALITGFEENRDPLGEAGDKINDLLKSNQLRGFYLSGLTKKSLSFTTNPDREAPKKPGSVTVQFDQYS